jgi:choline dehydrogenase-like flavoprotein
MSHPTHYDAIIVGGGPIGAHVARELTNAKKRVLILEAGRAGGLTYDGYRSYVTNFHTQVAKDTNSPYPPNASAPSPREIDLIKIDPGTPDLNGYQVEFGPQAFASTYLRQLGGTSLHWLGTVPRFLPNDFRLASKYGVGIDWPITYDEIEPYYCLAEWSIGVSGDRAEQETIKIPFQKGYEYPMEPIPPTYSDKVIDQAVREVVVGKRRVKRQLTVRLGDGSYPVRVSRLPQARNSIPNARAHPPNPDGVGVDRTAGPYRPVGAVGNPDMGLRCEGNSACIPICPVQAKYSALKTIDALDRRYFTLQAQCVVTKLSIAPNGRIDGVEYLEYASEGGATTAGRATADIYVLAGHSIENAKLLLASGAANSSDQVGRNLMDHPFSSAWALAPRSMGAFRGPLQSSGIESLRDGAFRKEFAAFRVDLGNVGWDIVPDANPPYGDLSQALAKNVFGKRLRRHLGDTVPRQVRIGYDIEQLPEAQNRVTISREFKDAIGCFRPVIHYDLSDYTWQSMVESIKVSKAVFDRLGIPEKEQYFVTTDATQPDERKFRARDGRDYLLSFVGAGHHMGTHRMGLWRTNSVVDRDQRSWDHENLYLVGCGSFPTTGTANPTLTAIALALRSTRHMLAQLH